MVEATRANERRTRRGMHRCGAVVAVNELKHGQGTMKQDGRSVVWSDGSSYEAGLAGRRNCVKFPVAKRRRDSQCVRISMFVVCELSRLI